MTVQKYSNTAPATKLICTAFLPGPVIKNANFFFEELAGTELDCDWTGMDWTGTGLGLDWDWAGKGPHWLEWAGMNPWPLFASVKSHFCLGKDMGEAGSSPGRARVDIQPGFYPVP